MKHRGLTVVAGAPRANHSGAVLLLKKENKPSGRLSVEHTLYGPGLASSFGYDVVVVDLNNDGYVTVYIRVCVCVCIMEILTSHSSRSWQDIVVGAPQFYMKNKNFGGAVYIYINKAGEWKKVTPVHLIGTKHSMFGLAVENVGDINQDTYQGNTVGFFYT